PRPWPSSCCAARSSSHDRRYPPVGGHTRRRPAGGGRSAGPGRLGGAIALPRFLLPHPRAHRGLHAYRPLRITGIHPGRFRAGPAAGVPRDPHYPVVAADLAGHGHAADAGGGVPRPAPAWRTEVGGQGGRPPNVSGRYITADQLPPDGFVTSAFPYGRGFPVP